MFLYLYWRVGFFKKWFVPGETKDTNKGNYVLERIDAAGEWKVCHAFYKHIIDEIVVNDVQRRVIEDEKSILIKDQLQ